MSVDEQSTDVLDQDAATDGLVGILLLAAA